MKTNKLPAGTPAGLLASLVLALLAGCQPSASPVRLSAAGDKAEQPSPRPSSQKSGPQLWSENCIRCHNIRPVESYSDAQWEAVVHHMRLRANLTGAEQRKIAEFLKASN